MVTPLAWPGFGRVRRRGEARNPRIPVDAGFLSTGCGHYAHLDPATESRPARYAERMLVQYTARLGRRPQRFPNRIRSYRVQAGLSQRALADRIGQRRASISAWERGRHLPNVVSLFRLARALDTLCESLYWQIYAGALRARVKPAA